MNISLGVWLCVAFVGGLLASGMPAAVNIGGFAIPAFGLIGAAGIAILGNITACRIWIGWGRRHGSVVAIVFLLATVYITARSPVAGPQDISRFVDRMAAIAAPTQVIRGTVLDEPSLNRNLKGRFRLAVEQVQGIDETGAITFQSPATGRTYVSAPLLQVTGLHAGQHVQAQGRLYLPQPALNPSGFDFQDYLEQQNTFAGFAATELNFVGPPPLGLWAIRQRIVRAQVRGLGSPAGQIVSAMALGRQAVDLPTNIRDLFTQVGLAHTIAASGFHVSLLLGVVLALLRSQSDRTRAILAAVVLLGYVALTGLQPSVMRAALMGGATLISLMMQRQVNAQGALLTAVTLMLLVNPNLIWQVGFQLSIAATWGLITTAPAITQWLNRLPVTIAALIAVPVAATLWTLPLSLYHFNVMAGLSIVLNALVTPLVSLISLGGMFSGVIALLWPGAGQITACLLGGPVSLLLGLARLFSHLPGSALVVGQIALWQLIALYGSLLTSCIPLRGFGGRSLLPAAAFLVLILGPLGWQALTQNQVTILAAGGEMIWVHQDHGHTTLVNSGDEQTAFYSVQPFLKQAGVNRVGHAIALPFGENYELGWQTLLQQTPVQTLLSADTAVTIPTFTGTLQTLVPAEVTAVGHQTAQLLGTQNPVLRMATPQTTWLLLPAIAPSIQTFLAQTGSALQSEVLVWDGGELSPELLKAIAPKVAVCYGSKLSETVERRLKQQGLQVFWTRRDGAVIWRPRSGFHRHLERKH